MIKIYSLGIHLSVNSILYMAYHIKSITKIIPNISDIIFIFSVAYFGP